MGLELRDRKLDLSTRCSTTFECQVSRRRERPMNKRLQIAVVCSYSMPIKQTEELYIYNAYNGTMPDPRTSYIESRKDETSKGCMIDR